MTQADAEGRYLPVQRMLAAHGLDVTPSELASELAAEPSLSAVRGVCERRGRSATLVRVSKRRLGSMARPALVQAGRNVYVVERSGRWLGVPADATLAADDRPPELAREGSALALEIAPPKRGRSFLSRLFHAASWTHFFTLALLNAGAAGLSLAPAWVTRRMLDDALPDHALGTLQALALALLAAAGQQAVIALLRDRLMRSTQASLQRAALQDAFERALAEPLAESFRRSVGESMQVVGSAELITGMAHRLATTLPFDLSAFAIALVSIAITLPALLPWSGGLLLLMLGATLVYGLRGQRYVTRSVESEERERTRLHELVSGIATYKALGCERKGVAHWLSELLVGRRWTIRKDRESAWFEAVLEGIHKGLIIVGLWVGGSAALEGRLSVGALVAGTMLLDQLAVAAQRLSGLILPLLHSIPHVQRVRTATRHDGDTPVRAGGAPAPAASIRLEDVWFRYGPDQPWILRGYNLTVRAGECVHLEGASGTGKTTILRLIAGLYTPERGTVLIDDDQGARSFDSVMYLPQQAHLFEGSLEHNLRLMSGAPRDAILAAAQRTGLDAWLATLPMHLETVMPPGGTSLSGGQRQWIAYTAAVASGRSVILLDEATSQIDRATRSALRATELFAGKTVIVAAHDL